MDSEQQVWAAEVAALNNDWATNPRWKFTKRPYSAEDVVSFRSTIDAAHPPKSSYCAAKFYKLCRERFASKGFTNTFGALDPVQVCQMAKYLECVYVSGWQCSSTASVTNEPGPDFADYPCNTVPNKVDQLFRAQQFHDRKQRQERMKMTPEQRAATPAVDYMRPIIADGDTGFGGMTSVMKLVKLQIEAGASAVHIEDQKPGAKKCGHMGGKVLVPIREHCDRLIAARLQADIMNAETMFVARTDSGSATFIENNIDPRDHPFIAGSTNADVGALEDTKDQSAWMAAAGICRYNEAVAAAMKAAGKDDAFIAAWNAAAMQLGNREARAHAASLGFGDVFWDWNAPRSREGYFRLKGGADYSVARAHSFSAAGAELIWMETATPSLAECKFFASGVHAKCPHQMLAYNLSPSFNWDAAGMDDNAIQSFEADIGALGFVWHFITLAGFHANALAIDAIAKAYAGEKKVLAYVTMIQREERRLGVETLTHQRWSGANYCDAQMKIATGGGASTSATEGSTEDQFAAKH